MTKLEEKIVVYEDPNLLIVNKPAAIPTVSSPDHPLSLTTMVRSLYHGLVSPCHRLDTNTTGLVIFGKTKESIQIINGMMKERSITKYYLAVVEGNVPEGEHALIDEPLVYSKEENFMAVGKNGKPANTEYVSIAEIDNTSLLLIRLGTGLTHQIRCHMSYLGLPVLGDIKYGAQPQGKMYLHACCLQFPYEKRQIDVFSLPKWNLDLKKEPIRMMIANFDAIY